MRFAWRKVGHPTSATFGLPPRWFVRGMRREPELESAYLARYAQTKDRAIAETLDDPAMLERFRVPAQLPRGFGFALDERIVEIPWAFAAMGGGRLLDAGSALNHPV